MAEVVLGLDLGSRNIKIAMIRQDKKSQVLKTTVLRTPDSSIIEGKIVEQEREKLAGVIRDWVDKQDSKPSSLAVSINSPDIIVRKFVLPTMEPTELALAIDIEIKKLFTSALDTHTTRYKILYSDGIKTQILAALCPTELLKNYEELAALIGIPLKFADIQANTQTKALKRFFETGIEGPALIVDVGYRSTLLSIADNGKLLLSRYVMAGVAAFDNLVANKAELSKDTVEHARETGDFSPILIDPDQMEQLMDFSLSEIEQQASQTLEFYEYEKPTAKVTILKVLGEGSEIPNIHSRLSNALGLALEELKQNRELPADTENPELMAEALGAALQTGPAGEDMNFLAEQIVGGTRKEKFGWRTIAIAAVAVLAISVLISAVLFIGQRLNINSIERIKKEIAASGSISSVDQQIDTAQRKQNSLELLIETIDKQNGSTAQVLDAISADAPENLFAMHMSILNGQELILTGKSKDYDSVANFALLLRENGAFSSILINSITANRTTAEDVLDYGLSITLKVARG